ncbi:MAG: hypothetical protein O3B01_06910 [Planctomycetota bacterium]|nr:hypothetical protein [Planctomycetota bacterium]MDA1138297.1 hypothetical protein [Planctomycetota bacterium]
MSYSKLHEKVAVKVDFELGQIQLLFDDFSDLLEELKEREPDKVELAAIGSILHAFYNGVENIFTIVGKSLDSSIPDGRQWHRTLLTQVSEASETRPALISSEACRALADYLAFRHFYRHSYTFHLDWDEMKGLVQPLPAVWAKVKSEIQAFVNTLLTATKDQNTSEETTNEGATNG